MPAPIIEIKLFSGLNEELKNVVIHHSTEKSILAGASIIWQDDECEAVYFILSGEVEIFRLSPGGREQILDRMLTGGCFNFVPAILENGLNQASVRALTDCKLMLISKANFNLLITKYPQFALAVTHFFAKMLAHMTGLVETLSLYSVRQRLAKFLIDQADAMEIQSSVRWTQTDIAKRLGTVRDVLGRTLRKMEEDGILKIDWEKILLIDRRQLEKAAAGEE